MIAPPDHFRDSCELVLSEDGGPVLYVRGERDVSNVEQLVACVELILTRCAKPRLTIDLSGATFIDACTIGALLDLQHDGRDRGCAVQVRNVPPS
jgi:Anti-anti-sigma regulatory factor (antagonist of anti-sigma factor)